MKKVLVGLLALGSITCFAKESKSLSCVFGSDTYVKTSKSGKVLTV